MANALTWTDVPRDLAATLLSPPFSAEEDESVIRKCLGIEETAATLPLPLPSPSSSSAQNTSSEIDGKALVSLRESVLITMYSQFISLARSLDFSERKLSTLLSIIRKVHESNQATTSASSSDKNDDDDDDDDDGDDDTTTGLPSSPPTIRTSYSQFSTLLVQHAVERPPYSVGVFSPADVSAVTSFMLSSYYSHYKLYQHAFAAVGEMHVKATLPGEKLAVETPQSEHVKKMMPSFTSVDAETVLQFKKRREMSESGGEAESSSGAVDDDASGGTGGLNDAMTQIQKDRYDEEQRIKEEERIQKEEEERERLEEEVSLFFLFSISPFPFFPS